MCATENAEEGKNDRDGGRREFIHRHGLLVEKASDAPTGMRCTLLRSGDRFEMVRGVAPHGGPNLAPFVPRSCREQIVDYVLRVSSRDHDSYVALRTEKESFSIANL